MTDAHHDAADRDKRKGSEAEFVRAEQRCDDDITPGHQLAVRLQPKAVAQTVQHERLMRFRQADLPRQAGMFDARARRRAGPAVKSADQEYVGARLWRPRRRSCRRPLRRQA